MLISRSRLRKVLVLVSFDRISDSLCCTSGWSMTWTVPAMSAERTADTTGTWLRRSAMQDRRARHDGLRDRGDRRDRRERDERGEERVADPAPALARCDVL